MRLIISKTDTGYIILNPPSNWEKSLPVGIITEVMNRPASEIKEKINSLMVKESSHDYYKTTLTGQFLYKHSKEKKTKECILIIEKKGKNYIVKNAPSNMPERFFITINEPQNKPQTNMDDTVYLEIKTLAEKYPDDTLLQKKLEYYAPYPEAGNLSDDDILFLALKEKYDL